MLLLYLILLCFVYQAYIYIIFFFRQTSIVSWVHDLSLSRATHCFNQLSISICMLHRTTHWCCSEGFSSKYEFQIRPLLYVLIHASCSSYSLWHVIPLGFNALFGSVCTNSFLSWMFPMMLEMIAVLFREACSHSISIENGGEHFWYMHGTVLYVCIGFSESIAIVLCGHSWAYLCSVCLSLAV